MGLKLPRAARLIPVAGLAAAVAFAVMLNAFALRHYRRWDVTTARLHVLSPATVETLRGLSEPIDIWILLGRGEAIRESVRRALEAYAGHTSQLRIHSVDPFEDTAAYEDVRRRFRLEAGRSEEGHAAENLALIVARGDRHWFVERSDLVEVVSDADARVRPREERALTAAIRAVISGEKAKVCFVAGHDEPAIADFGPRGAGGFAELLRQDNYEPVALDTSLPGHPSFDGCRVVVVATPRRTFSKEEEAHLRTYLLEGGNALFALSPVASKQGFVAPGVSSALAPFGIALSDALVVETDPNLVFPESRGTLFAAGVRTHAVTASLAAAGPNAPAPPPVVVSLVRPLRRASDAADLGGLAGAAPAELLSTSDGAFGVVHVDEDTAWTEMPNKAPSDLSGPLPLAMASERPKLGPNAAHGPRVVVIGTSSVLARAETDPLMIGAGYFAEGAVSWLAARPPVLDIPDRPAITAGVRLTEASQREVDRYVLFLIPLTFVALGIVVGWSRRRRPDSGARVPRSS